MWRTFAGWNGVRTSAKSTMRRSKRVTGMPLIGRDLFGSQGAAVVDPDAFEGAFSRGNDINARGAEARDVERVPQAKWLMLAPGPRAKVAASHWASRERGASANV